MVKQKTSNYMLPKDIILFEKFIYNKNGKIDRKVIISRIEKNISMRKTRNIISTIIDLFPRLKKINLNMNSDLINDGIIDSLELLGLIEVLEKKYKFDLKIIKKRIKILRLEFRKIYFLNKVKTFFV